MQNANFVARALAALHVQAALANTNVLAADLTPSSGWDVVFFRIQVLVTVAGVFSAIVTRGGVAQTQPFNNGAALTANALHQFDLFVHSGDSVNFQTSVGANMSLRVHEVRAMVS